jgi:periplasmic protein TonB
MEANKILQADFLDLLFDGRNKEYGAYELRKTYNKRITAGIIGMLILCLLIFLAVVLANRKEEVVAPTLVQEVNLENIEEKKPEEPLPPPPPEMKPPEPAKLEINKFTPPKIVKDNEVKQEDEIKEVEELEKAKIGTFNQEGKQLDVVAPPVEVKGTGGDVIAPKTETEDYDKEFKSVQIEAKFPGGAAEWAKFLQRNLNADEPVNQGAPPGRYVVVVSFLVDKDGSISEVRAENNPSYGTAEEAVRVIKKGPKWVPAVQNGRNVIYRQKQQITFVVSE